MNKRRWISALLPTIALSAAVFVGCEGADKTTKSAPKLTTGDDPASSAVKADRGEFPGSVVVSFSERDADGNPVNKNRYCGGTVIGTSAILTAMSCLENHVQKDQRITVIGNFVDQTDRRNERINIGDRPFQVKHVRTMKKNEWQPGKTALSGQSFVDVAVIVVDIDLQMDKAVVLAPENVDGYFDYGFCSGQKKSLDRLPKLYMTGSGCTNPNEDELHTDDFRKLTYQELEGQRLNSKTRYGGWDISGGDEFATEHYFSTRGKEGKGFFERLFNRGPKTPSLDNNSATFCENEGSLDFTDTPFNNKADYGSGVFLEPYKSETKKQIIADGSYADPSIIKSPILLGVNAMAFKEDKGAADTYSVHTSLCNQDIYKFVKQFTN